MKKYIVRTLMLCFIILTSCNKAVLPPKNDPEVIKEKGKVINNTPIKSITIDASDYNNWVYFSFEKGTLIKVTDPMNDKSWDLGFKRSYVKSNGGTSGIGMADAMETPFNTFKDIKTEFFTSLKKDFKKDIRLPIPTDPNQDGNIVYVDESYNEELNKGIALIIRQTNAPIIRYSGKIYFFHSSNGKSGAIKFTSYQKEIDKIGALKGGYVSIEYQYPIEIHK